MAGLYGKGARAERELVQHFSSLGFCVIRAAGSGVNSLSPDLLIFKRGIQYAIESKAHETLNLAISKDQFENLQKWEEITGITPLIAWKVNRQGWKFLHLSLFSKNEKSYSISLENAWRMGKNLEEIG
ncbi:Holliday junction resolvase Hjc [Candidatus Anstonella stagnisolia]|nr:Holliday junction resolvase Hjc [Candidatus Anstonella stagnisolia]